MRKITFVVVFLAVGAILLTSVGSVFAQSGNPPTPGYGPGSGGCGPMQNGGQRGDGWMHDEMIAILSQKLGITATDLEARLDKGESMADIAAAEGLTRDEFVTLMRDARSELIDQAVKDGKITEQQANWMKTRGMRMMQRWQEFRENWGNP